MSKIWFTADYHLHHGNIIKYCNRPFSTADEMDEIIIQRHNELVKPGDLVFFLGDFAFTRGRLSDAGSLDRLLGRFNGTFYLVKGNHDREIFKISHRFGWIRDLAEVRCGDKDVILCHYAMRIWNKRHYGTWHLYGHSHGTLPDDPNSLSLDVGVDSWDFRPVSMEQIEGRMSQKNFIPIGKKDEDK